DRVVDPVLDPRGARDRLLRTAPRQLAVSGSARRCARLGGRDHGLDGVGVCRAAHQGRAVEGGDRRARRGRALVPRALAGRDPAACRRGRPRVARAKADMTKFVLLLWIFLKSTCTSFAGLASLPEIRHDLVEERHWLTNEQIDQSVVITRTTPGPVG